jgi:hypothetical protein
MHPDSGTLKSPYTVYHHPTAHPLPLREGLDLRMAGRILRVEGLVPFTGAAILIGFGVVVWEGGFCGCRLGPVCGLCPGRSPHPHRCPPVE